MTEAMPLTRRLRRVAPLALVVVVVAACGDNDKTSVPPLASTTATTGTGPSAIGGGTKPSGKATLVAEKRNLLPLLQGDLSRFVPTQVEGKALKVVALAGTDAFWAGRSSDQRILVTMRLKGSEAPKITIGQKVGFIGLLMASPADAGSLGVASGGDTTLLEKQGAYVNASVADVKLS